MKTEVSSRLVLIEPLLEQAFARPVERPKHKKGISVMLACQPEISLRLIAKDLKVRADEPVFEENPSGDRLASLRRFCSFEIVLPIAPRTFINLKATQRMHRSANPREILSFIESYPQKARRQRIVCLCSGKVIMSNKTGYPAMIVFEPQGEGFSARVDYDSTEIAAGSVVIMKVDR